MKAAVRRAPGEWGFPPNLHLIGRFPRPDSTRSAVATPGRLPDASARLGRNGSSYGRCAELRRYSPFLLSSRRDNPTEAQGETRRVSRALSLPWVRGHLSAESQRDGPNPRRIVQLAPFRTATLWLPVFWTVYPGQRQRSLRSRCLALGFDSVVPLGLSQHDA